MARRVRGWLTSHPDLAAATMLFGAALLFLSPYLARTDLLLWPRSGLGTDFLHYRWTHATHVRNSLRDYGQFPLWYGNVLVGQPLVGNPASILFYPLHLLLVLSPLPVFWGFALLAVSLAWQGWQAWQRGRRDAAWGAAGALVGGTVLPFYIWIGLGYSPVLLFQVQQARYGVGFHWPGLSVLEALCQILSGQTLIPNLIELLFTLAFLALALPVWRRLPRLYGLYYLALMGLFLVRVGGAQPLLGITRFVLALFPAFIVLGDWGARPWIQRAYLYSSWVGLLFLSGQFAIWGWVG